MVSGRPGSGGDPRLHPLEAGDVGDLGIDARAQPLALVLRQVQRDLDLAALPAGAPAAHHYAVLDDDGTDPAASPFLDVQRVLAGDGEGPVLPPEQIGVEVAEHPDLSLRR